VPVDTNISAGIVGTGIYPYGAAYDPDNQELYIVNYVNENLTVVNATSGGHVTDIAMSANTTGVAYVPWNHDIYALVEGSSSIAVIDTTTNTVGPTIALSGEPDRVVYDPSNQRLYATIWTVPSQANHYTAAPIGLQAVYTSNNTAMAPVLTGFDGAYELAVDPSDNTVWVENSYNDTISIFSPASDAVVRWVQPGPQPSGASLQGGIVYSPVGDQVFVVNFASVGTVNVFGASNYTLVRSGIRVGSDAYGASATYDPASQCVYVASYAADTVTVISAVDDSIAEPTIAVPGGPWTGVYDPTTGALFFLLSVSGGAAWIFGGIAVDFNETGLPEGSRWTVDIAGDVQSSDRPIISLVEPVGVGRYYVSAPDGYAAANQSGQFTVPSTPVAPVDLTFTFGPPTYPVDFTEQGLPSGASWSVQVNSSAPVVRPSGGVVNLLEPNGTYPYVVRSETTA
jgi:YVTN family beta-propeller protein